MKEYRQKLIRQIIILGVAFFCWTGLTSAQGWEKTFSGPSIDVAYQVVATADGNIVTSIQSLGGLGFPPGFLGVILIKMDTLGNTIWSQPIPETSFSFTATNDGGTIHCNRGSNLTNINQVTTIFKLDSNGETEWTQSYPTLTTGNDTLYIHNILQTSDNGFVFSGFRLNNGTNQFLAKIDGNGSLLWSQDLSMEGGGYHLAETSNQEILIAGAGNTTDTSFHLTLMKTDALGNLLWSQEYAGETSATQVAARTNGEIALTTSQKVIKLDSEGDIISSVPISWSFNALSNPNINRSYPTEDGFITSSYTSITEPYDVGFTLARYDDEGNHIWSHLYNYFNDEDFSYGVTATADGGFVTVGYTTSSTIRDAYILKTDENGIVYGNEFSGNVKLDENEDCVLDYSEVPIDNWVITATRAGRTFATFTDENGDYFLPVDTGTFELSVVLPVDYWSACQNDFIFNYPSISNKDTVDFAIQSVIDCPSMEVNTVIPAIRPCFENNALYVNWCNNGTILAEDAYLEIILDSDITPIPGTPPWDVQSGDTLIYDLGDVPVGECGDFKLFLMLDCYATIGAAYCIESHIYPDSLCSDPSSAWEGAYVEVSGACQDSTVSFQIENSGVGNMTQDGQYIIVEDAVLLMNNNFNLLSGETNPLEFSANGSTYVLIATQEPNAPGNNIPIASLEGCGLNGTGDFSTGFLNSFPLGDSDSFTDVDCPEASAAYDPNDKQGFPKGYSSEHYIEPNTDIEYLIRFQNTGTDTAFNVIILDTLDQSLDLSSLRQGVGTHDYELNILNGNVLEFTFADIMLPDSNVNEAASHGAVEFKISQKRDLPLGTVIKNRAAIYFDFNAPIITNETFHTLGLDFIVVSAQSPVSEESRILVRPNPMRDHAIFEFERTIHKGRFELYNLNGQLTWEQELNSDQFELKRNSQLIPGIYFYKISENGLTINSGKIIVN